MQNFMITLLTCSATMSAIALLYMALTPLLSKRYSPKGRYYTWLVVVLGLIIPFRPHLGSALVNVNVPAEMALPNMQTGHVAPTIEPISTAQRSFAAPSLSIWQILTLVWLVGALVFLLTHAVKYRRFMKLVDRWCEDIADGYVALSVLEKVKAEMGIADQIGLQICPSIGSPMLVGFAHPKILLPDTDFAEEELRFIIAHELVHHKRKDLYYKVLVLVATAIHWFNPAVYIAAKAIDAECELSCDDEVIRSTDAVARQHYSKTILGVVKYQSRFRTALSTNFYGGKKGMKKRIFSIMDIRNKKTGTVILCAVLILTLGTGLALAANGNPPEIIKESIVISPQISIEFIPDPDTYAQYAPFGIAISDDGRKLLYEGQPVRLFVDEKSDTEAFYLDEDATANLSVVRNAAGKITGIESIDVQKAQAYKDAFFADEPGAVLAGHDIDTAGPNKYDQYQAFGITYSTAEEILYFKDQRVKLFVDQYPDGWFGTFWTDDAGTENLEVRRDASGQITGIESISDERAQEYLAAATEEELEALNGLDEKIAEKVDALYPVR